MKVLHLNAGNLYGGVETFLVTLARYAFMAPNMSQEFGLCYPDGRYAAELSDAGVPTHALGVVRFSRPWTVWAARRRLRRLLRQQKYDVGVCHMSWSHAVFGPVLQACGVPVVHWAHGVTAGQHWVERRASRIRPRTVICNSQFTAQSVPNVFSDSPTQVLHCPVPLRMRSDLAVRTAVRHEWATPPDATVIVQVSRMEEWKGQRDLLRALALIDRETGSWVCWFVGGAQRPAEEAYRAELERTAADLGLSARVRFLGARSDVPELLSAADVFCQPNREPEPFGLVFIEALAAGLPVVTSAVGGGAEIVTVDCGELVPPGDPHALAASLTRLLADPAHRLRLGAAGPRRAAELCDPARQLPAIAAALGKVIV